MKTRNMSDIIYYKRFYLNKNKVILINNKSNK